MQVPLSFWIGFNLFVFLMLVLDLCVFNRHSKVISIKQALITSALWIGLALCFNYGVYIYLGKEAALNFLAGYLIEESLSIDNLFVFLLIFKFFQTPPKYQYKVLFWGILGAVIMRAGFIFFGVSLVKTFHWVLYLFGAFLIYTGIKMALPSSDTIHPDKNPMLNLLKKWFPFTDNYEGENFFVKRQHQWFATPLFAVLLAIETTDLVFALDSIPAIMAITLDPFIIYTSNIFAILGLRSLFFALSGLMSLFHFLHYGLSAILVFVGLKMLLEPFVKVPIGVALGFIVVALSSAIIASKLYPPSAKP